MIPPDDQLRFKRLRHPKFSPVVPEPITPAKVIHGVVGIAKAVVGVDRPSEEVIASRLAICNGCEHATLLAGVVKQCAICKCAFFAKVRNASEKCPLDKWLAVS